MKDPVMRTSSISLTAGGRGCDDKTLQAAGTRFIRAKTHPMDS